jgi:4-hydroxymandelate oxidase
MPGGNPERSVPPWMSPDELEAHAKEQLPEDVYHFVAGGAGDELTLRSNLTGFDRFYLRPRVLVDVGAISTGTQILGSPLAAPIFVAPMGGQSRIHSNGETACATGAAQAGVGFMLSALASVPIGDVTLVAPETRWYQLYFFSRDRAVVADRVAQAESLRYKAIVVTADAPVANFIRRSARYDTPDPTTHAQDSPWLRLSIEKGVVQFDVNASDPTLDWTAIEWLRSQTHLPIAIKGIMTPEDALTAVRLGVDAIVISNHGGRSMDHTLGAIEALPEIVDAIQGRIPIVLDGGIRRGSDISIALSLGANAVSVGRPALWALQYGGALGVATYFRALIIALARSMAWLGVRNVSDFSSANVGRR